MNKAYADGNVNMNYSFHLLLSFTKYIMTVVILFEQWNGCTQETGDERDCGNHLLYVMKSGMSFLVLGGITQILLSAHRKIYFTWIDLI